MSAGGFIPVQLYQCIALLASGTLQDVLVGRLSIAIAASRCGVVQDDVVILGQTDPKYEVIVREVGVYRIVDPNDRGMPLWMRLFTNGRSSSDVPVLRSYFRGGPVPAS